MTIVFIRDNKIQGSATYAVLPLVDRKDFHCSPKDIISFEEGVRIGSLLDQDVVIGETGDMEWRVDDEGAKAALFADSQIV